MKFIDSNVLAFAFYQNPHIEKCQEIILEGGLINTFNLIEAFFIIEKETNREIAKKSIKGLLKSNISIVDVDVNLVFESLKRADLKLSIFDLIHYTTALINDCEAIVSYDKDFNNLDIPREEG